MRRVVVNGQALALYQVDGTYYATAAICTHAEAELTEGRLEGCHVICPLHGAAFDIRTGRVLSPPAFKPLKTRPVRVRDGLVEVEFV